MHAAFFPKLTLQLPDCKQPLVGKPQNLSPFAPFAPFALVARAGDAPWGNTVIWRGMARLTDIEIGFLLGAQHVVIESRVRRLLSYQQRRLFD